MGGEDGVAFYLEISYKAAGAQANVIVILDADGTVAYTGIGRDQDIDAAIRGVLASEPAG